LVRAARRAAAERSPDVRRPAAARACLASDLPDALDRGSRLNARRAAFERRLERFDSRRRSDS
jgi:hypothetical protein